MLQRNASINSWQWQTPNHPTNTPTHARTHMVTPRDQKVTQVGAHKPGAASDQHPVLLHPWLGLDCRALLARQLRGRALLGGRAGGGGAGDRRRWVAGGWCGAVCARGTTPRARCCAIAEAVPLRSQAIWAVGGRRRSTHGDCIRRLPARPAGQAPDPKHPKCVILRMARRGGMPEPVPSYAPTQPAPCACPTLWTC